MKLFTILGQNPDITDREDLFAEQDGFSLRASLISAFWFLWRGMWLPALVTFAAFVAVSLVPSVPAQCVLWFLIALWVGFEARFMHLEHLQRQGLVILAQVNAPGSAAAIDIFLADRQKSPMKAPNVANVPMASTSSAQPADMIFGRS